MVSGINDSQTTTMQRSTLVKVQFNGSLSIKVPNAVPRENNDQLKAWIWENQRDELVKALSMEVVDEHSVSTPSVCTASFDQRQTKLLAAISHVQRQYFQREDKAKIFGGLLDELLELTESEYGFIGEVRSGTKGAKFLKCHAVTNISWDTETQKLFEENRETGLEFHNLDTLFGKVIRSKQSVIANDPKNHPDAGGIPKGHPPLDHFLGIPFFKQEGEMNGMVGISNKLGGYTQHDIDFLEPFTVTCNNLIEAFRQIEENRRLINTLEENVASRTKQLQDVNRSLNAANQRIQASSKRQLQHFACMSHEIRTPLNCIIGMSNLLSESSMTPMQEESIRMIIASGDLLLAIVNDVLDFAKLETENIVINAERSNLQDLFNSVVESINAKALSKSLSIKTIYDIALPQFADIDSRRVQQILFNLLGNAVKFSRENGIIELTVEIVEETNVPNNCILRFKIMDYGTGIAESEFDSIFEPFHQAPGDDKDVMYGGTGLGLPITKKLVTAMGGNIFVDSEKGSWTKFTAEFPVVCTPATRQEHSLDGSTVYCLGLNAGQRDVVQRTLQAFDVAHHFMPHSNTESLHIGLDSSSGQNATIAIVNEDIFTDEVSEALSKRGVPGVLTFGPRHSGHDRQCLHIRSLEHTMPSVLIERLALLVNPANCAREESNTTPTNALASSFSKLHVLVAEDNLVNQKVLAMMLKRLGVEKLDIVDNGQTAVEYANERDYDIVLMDQ